MGWCQNRNLKKKALNICPSHMPTYSASPKDRTLKAWSRLQSLIPVASPN